jgi:hypothetical protein
VSTLASALPRRLELSPAAFRRLAWWTSGWLVLIVATGATVRLTGSGLGCLHWPGCTPHRFEPRGFHSDVEFGNRVVAAVTVAMTLAFAAASLVARRVPRWMRVVAWLVFVGTLAQAPLGAITIHYDLNPYLVISHLLLSLLVLGLAVVVAAAGDGPAPAACSRRRPCSSSPAPSRPPPGSSRARTATSTCGGSAPSSRRSRCTSARSPSSASCSSCSPCGRGGTAPATGRSCAAAPA